jgi:hypothetical protein
MEGVSIIDAFYALLMSGLSLMVQRKMEWKLAQE